MTTRALLVLLLALTGCYSIRTTAPPGSSSTFASDYEACATISSRRVHSGCALPRPG